MAMESGFPGFSGSLRSFQFDDETLLPYPDQYGNCSNGFRLTESAADPGFMDHPLLIPDQELNNSVVGTDADSPTDDSGFSETVFKYISQMLMEEDMEEEQISLDPLALQAAEKSLGEVISEKSPSSLNFYPSYVDSPPDDNYSANSSDYGGKSSCSGSVTSGSNFAEPQWYGDFGDYRSTVFQSPIPQNFTFQSVRNPSVQLPFRSSDGLGTGTANERIDSWTSRPLFRDLSTESASMSQFQRGVEEARKFLPKYNPFFLDLDQTSSFHLSTEEIASIREVKIEKDEGEYVFANGLREKKHHEREDIELEEGRSNKQSAVSSEEVELTEMFDKFLIFPHGRRGGHCKAHGPPDSQAEANEKPHQNGQTPNSSNGVKARPKKPINVNTKKEVVDLRMLLILSAQAVSANDRRTANEYLKQIRQHSSPFGDGFQRMAHYFANGLEARLEGNGTQNYNALAPKRTSAVEVLKAYQVYLSACPFQKLANIFTNNMILVSAEKATTVHIIDFGILYGFQWPALIFRLSRRAGGPPKLRITGIELPERGFRPAERVQQTGHHLAKCCERFNIPFEYNAIAQKWETIRIDDLKLRKGEMVVVNSMFRFKNLLDETVVLNNPRDSVLHLVKKIKPDLFTQAVVNGSYNAPFFVTRFREALFHYSALFDALDSSLAREDEMRLRFEKECYGREVMNIIACEGLERVERPETYKQWQIRTMRAGFKQLPLDPMIMKKLKFKLKAGYNEDFVIDEDGHWMLQGWKGRILYASSYWVPA